MNISSRIKALYFNRIFSIIEWCMVSAGMLGVLALVYLFDSIRIPFSPRCSFLYATGLYCPGCGLTRGTRALIHGHFLEALDYNLLLLTLLPLAFFSYYQYTRFRLLGRKDFPKLYKWNKVAWAFLISLFGFWILRNIPIVPLTYLAP